MIHDDILERAARGLDEGFTDAQRAEIEEHMRGCSSCRNEWERMRTAHAALLSWGAVQAPSPQQSPAAPISPSIRTGTPPRWLPWLAAASIACLLAGANLGYFFGRRSVSTTVVRSDANTETRPVFALMLEEPRSAWPPSVDNMRPGYVAWRDSLDAAGAFDGGARLTADDGWYVSTNGEARPTGEVGLEERVGPNYSGFFEIRARDYSEAIAIARSSPHLAFGGILIRRIASP